MQSADSSHPTNPCMPYRRLSRPAEPSAISSFQSLCHLPIESLQSIHQSELIPYWLHSSEQQSNHLPHRTHLWKHLLRSIRSAAFLKSQAAHLSLCSGSIHWQQTPTDRHSPTPEINTEFACLFRYTP